MIFNKISGNVDRKELFEKAVELVKNELKKCKDKKMLQSITFRPVDPKFLLNEYDSSPIIYYNTTKYFEKHPREIYNTKEFDDYQTFFYDLAEKINSKIEEITNNQYHCFESGSWKDGYIFLSTETEDA